MGDKREALMKDESTALKISAGANLSFGLLGIGFALLTQSGAILLDGFFSFIGFGIGLLHVPEFFH